MANSDSSSPLPHSMTTKENLTPVSIKIEELNETRSDLRDRIQGVRKDLDSWRSRLDSKVEVYGNEVTDFKQFVNREREQLRTQFQQLRTTLQQQRDDVTTILQNFREMTADDEVEVDSDNESCVSTVEDM